MLIDYLSKLNDVVDPEHVARSEERMRASVCFEPVDRLPLAVHSPVDGWKVFPYRETFHDMEKMLMNELNQVWIGAHIRDDRIYTIRANYGVGTIASMFGCETVLTGDTTMPWAHPLDDDTLDKVLEQGPVDVEFGLGDRAVETERYYLDVLSEYDNLSKCVHVFMADTQGPFDIAHLVMGHKIYTEIYDNPERVHRLMNLTTDAYIRFTRVQKEIIGEGYDFSYHSQMVFRGGVRLCDDSGINLSAPFYREFSKPYNERALTALGGGWIHYCGGGYQILPEVLTTEDATGINFGNPEMQNINQIYEKAREKSMAVLGWPLAQGLPEDVKTGMTLSTDAADLDTARQMALG